MKSSHIKDGDTYLFVATDSLERRKLVGSAFTVVEIKNVFRRLKFRGGTRKVKRFFDADGNGARAEELEPLDVPAGKKWEDLTDEEQQEVVDRQMGKEAPL